MKKKIKVKRKGSSKWERKDKTRRKNKEGEKGEEKRERLNIPGKRRDINT